MFTNNFFFENNFSYQFLFTRMTQIFAVLQQPLILKIEHFIRTFRGQNWRFKTFLMKPVSLLSLFRRGFNRRLLIFLVTFLWITSWAATDDFGTGFGFGVGFGFLYRQVANSSSIQLSPVFCIRTKPTNGAFIFFRFIRPEADGRSNSIFYFCFRCTHPSTHPHTHTHTQTHTHSLTYTHIRTHPHTHKHSHTLARSPSRLTGLLFNPPAP